MTPADLRVWQAHMGYTYDTAAAALGVGRSTYADWVSGVTRSTGAARPIDKRTALACAALAAGLEPWGPTGITQAESAQPAPV